MPKSPAIIRPPLMVVLDPENHDPTYGDIGEAILTLVHQESQSLLIGRASVSIEDLLVAAQRVVANLSRLDTKVSVIDTDVVRDLRDLRDILATIGR